MSLIPKKLEQGFTIVELMIALSVMSVILVMSTIILIQIGGLYDKGVSASDLQNTARGIVNDVASAIQFSGYDPAVATCTPASCSFNGANGDPVPGEYAYCIGTVRYSYILNTEIGNDIAANPATGAPANTNTPHILWRDQLSSYKDDPCVPVNLNAASPSDSYSSPGTGVEMMSDHTRLTNFSITPVSGTGTTNTYTINVSSAYGDSDLLNLNGTNTSCKSQFTSSSTQFCSLSSVTLTADGRVY